MGWSKHMLHRWLGFSENWNEKQTQGADVVQLQLLTDVAEHRVVNANLHLTSRQSTLRRRLLMQITIFNCLLYWSSCFGQFRWISLSSLSSFDNFTTLIAETLNLSTQRSCCWCNFIIHVFFFKNFHNWWLILLQHVRSGTNYHAFGISRHLASEALFHLIFIS